MKSFSLVLADDHVLVREALRNLLEASLPEMKIVGEASTGVEALDLWRQHHPDVLVLDLAMPDLGGLDVLAELQQAGAKTRVLVVSQYCDQAYVLRALRLGAKAYLPKKALAKDLVAAVRAVLEGRTYLDPSVANLVVDAAIHPEASPDEGDLAKLTQREKEVLRLTAEGKTAKEVAKVLGISLHTANRHRANLMEKLDLHSKSDLVRTAVRLKIIDV